MKSRHVCDKDSCLRIVLIMRIYISHLILAYGKVERMNELIHHWINELILLVFDIIEFPNKS